jgi:glycosyltransferase involved in cell wall biosynthesis
MKIAFDLYNTGLGNNGGSRTIVKCAEMLQRVGCKVRIFSNVQDRYTWDLPLVDIVKKNRISSKFAIISTGYYSLKHTLKSHSEIGTYCYIRGHELWNAKEDELLKLYGKFKSGHCIVNSEWLKELLENHGIKAKLIYPGIDEVFHVILGRTCENKLGALYSERHQTKRHEDAIKVSELSGFPVRMLNKDIIDPTENKLNKWYNQFKVWFAPTELEGLHNCPIEASQAGCAVVCSDHPRNGMSDYARHQETALVYPARDLDMASRYITQLMEDEELRQKLNQGMVDLLRNKIKTRRDNMIELRDYIFAENNVIS